MGRRKIEIKAIKDDRNRSVTFLKRKGGLFKKAHELSVLCSVDVAVIIFGHNKKLYEFSSGDIGETLTRYSYYGTPHEHKGPSDFRGKGGEDDEDEDEDEEAGGREESMPPQHIMPPHIQHANSFPHLRQPAASASPPMQNGMFQHRHSTPQPYMGSRPSSRNAIRRTSSNLIPLQHPHSTPPPPPPQNGYAYMPNPPIYNPQANNGLQPPPQPSPQPQYQQFHPPPQSSHQQVQQAQQAFMAEQRRQSQGQIPPQDRLQPPPPQPTRASPQPELKPPGTSPPQPRHLSSKSKSIFTPIDEGGSVLAAHFFDAPAPRSFKKEGSPDRLPPRSAPSKPMPQPARTQSTTSEFAPPSRTNTNSSKSGAARPRLKVQIPSEASDDEMGTGSPHGSGAASATPARGSSESHHSGVVLPPPSPSASALLSAGASGPPNPFARPPPPANQNTSAYNDNRNNIETPISALPSRFVADGLLPSPSSFYPEWGFGRSGPDSNMLPSPLTFPTPIMATGPGFGRGEVESLGEKRKGSEEKLADAKKQTVISTPEFLLLSKQNTPVNEYAAAHPSATTAYLSPPGPEPQQRAPRREHRRRGKEADHHREFHNENHYPSAAAHTTPSHVSGCGGGATGLSSFETERHQYAQDNLLQSYDVYVPGQESETDEPESLNDKYWIIYIHGGYYRDPKITAGSFQRTLSFLFSSPLYAHAASLIAGVASLNYRLSAHPDYPQDTERTPKYELRNAKHPDHIDDVLTAIGVLQKKYGFGERYLLVGHSVGATMAFQAALSQHLPWNPTVAAEFEQKTKPPVAILGVEGIYDFPLIVRSVPDEVRDKYFEPTRGAFGKNENVWLEASPAQYSAEAYARNWGEGRRLVIVAHSRQDELVDWGQVRAIRKVFSERVEGDLIKFEMLELKGKHHEVWEKGELARAIAEAIRSLKVLSNAEPRRDSGVRIEKKVGQESRGTESV